jgi:signal peptidase II
MNKIFYTINNNIEIIIIQLILFTDYITKSFILKNFKSYHEIKILNILNIIYVKNYGFIFGWYSYKKIWNYMFINLINIIFITIIIILIYNLFLKKNLKKYYEISFIISGFIGNTIDRIKYGYIIDFFDLHYKNLHFPTFNISDISIIFGCILLFFKNNK